MKKNKKINKKTRKKEENTKLSSFFTRFLSGVVLIALLVFVLIQGGDILFCACALLSILGLVEIFRVFKIANTRIAILGYLFVVFYYLMLHFYKSSGILLFLIAMVLFLLMFYVISFPKFSIKEVALVCFSLIYVAVMFSFIYLIREKNELGKYFVWLIFIASWGSDTCAYCTGMLIGKHKFSPILSPKKTVEGAIGGIIGAALLGALYTYLMFNKIVKEISFSCMQVSIACAIGACISMIGDLTASGIKREYGVKDYGNIIPGHGGILDRFDSVIFTAPALFFLLSI